MTKKQIKERRCALTSKCGCRTPCFRGIASASFGIVATLCAARSAKSSTTTRRKRAIGMAHDQNAADLLTENTKMQDALLSIKGLVCGGKHPGWASDFKITQTRSHIADLCDVALRTNR